MIAVRVQKQQSKFAASIMLDRDSNTNTLNRELALKRPDQDDIYEAMDNG